MAISSFLHPGLECFAKSGSTQGISANHASKLNQLLALLSFSGGNMPHLRSVPGFHSLKLKYQSDTYAVKVSGSWRLTFRVSDKGDIFDMDYLQYH